MGAPLKMIAYIPPKHYEELCEEVRQNNYADSNPEHFSHIILCSEHKGKVMNMRVHEWTEHHSEFLIEH